MNPQQIIKRAKEIIREEKLPPTRIKIYRGYADDKFKYSSVGYVTGRKEDNKIVEGKIFMRTHIRDYGKVKDLPDRMAHEIAHLKYPNHEREHRIYTNKLKRKF